MNKQTGKQKAVDHISSVFLFSVIASCHIPYIYRFIKTVTLQERTVKIAMSTLARRRALLKQHRYRLCCKGILPVAFHLNVRI